MLTHRLNRPVFRFIHALLAMFLLSIAITRQAKAGSVTVRGNVTVDASTAVSFDYNPVSPAPAIQEAFSGEWSPGGRITVIAPINFAFDTSITQPTLFIADLTPGNGFSFSQPILTASTITFDVVTPSTLAPTQLRFDNMRLRATACSPLVNPGDTAEVIVVFDDAPLGSGIL